MTRRRLGRGSRLITARPRHRPPAGRDRRRWARPDGCNRNWLWILAAPVLFFAAAAIGLLDPVAIYCEKRHHELWIATGTVAPDLAARTGSRSHKAMRPIQRARERDREQHGSTPDRRGRLRGANPRIGPRFARSSSGGAGGEAAVGVADPQRQAERRDRLSLVTVARSRPWATTPPSRSSSAWLNPAGSPRRGG